MIKTVLYVDDNSNDALMFRHALEKQRLQATMYVAADGCDAAEWLTGTGFYSDKVRFPQPHLLVIDLQMPRNSGFDLLEFVQARRDLKKIPVIVYTDSDDPSDKQRAFALGANAYVCKASGLDKLMHYVRSVIKSVPSDSATTTDYAGSMD